MDMSIWRSATHVLMIAAMVPNCIVIHILRRKRQKKSYETFLLSLSVGEIVEVPLHAISYICITFVKENINIMIIFSLSCTLFIKLLTLHHLIVISADRMWAVASPLTHRVHATGRKVFAAIACCWICPSLISVGYMMVHVLAKTQNPLLMIYSLNSVLATGIVVADVMFCICYGTIIATIYKKKTLLGNTLEYQLRVFRLCMGTVLIFVLSNTPFVVTYIDEWNRPQWIALVSVTMLPVNTIATSLLFLYQNRQSKRQQKCRITNCK